MTLTAEAPQFAVVSSRWRLDHAVPFDEWRVVRISLMLSYLGVYLWWLREWGLPIDRISVAISVGIFLVCAFIGRTWRTWMVLLGDAVAYCVMWVTYERTRDWADNGFSVFDLFTVKFPLQVESVRNIDRVLFFGSDPNVVLQQRFWEPTVRWYDVVASSVYMTHFVVPVVAMALLWATSHRQWIRFMKRFATLLGVACAMFVILPTAPPWMVASPKYPYQLFDELHRNAGRGFLHLGFSGFTNDYGVQLSKGNAVAAMPSLHASFALIVPLFFIRWVRQRWVRIALLSFPALMLTSLVYLGEHWVIDGIVGWLITVATFLFWDWHERRTRGLRVDIARDALGIPGIAAATTT